MRTTYHRWPSRQDWERAAAEAGWRLDQSGVPQVPGLQSIAGFGPALTPPSPGDEPVADLRWHLVLATSQPLPAPIAAAERDAQEAPFWWSGVPRVEPPPPPPAPQPVSGRRFKAALALAGIITEAEMVSNDLPVIVAPVLATMSTAERIVARATWAHLSLVEGNEPLLAVFAAAHQPPLGQADIAALMEAARSIP